MKVKLVYFTFFLLVIYALSAFYIPEYLGREVFRLEDSLQNSYAYASEMEKAIKESKHVMTKENTLMLVLSASRTEVQRIADTKALISLMQEHAFILFGLLLMHISALISFLRARPKESD